MINISLLYYDKAIYKKLHDLYDEVYFASPEEAFKVNAKRHEGRVLLPFISVWRLPDFNINRAMYNDIRVRKGPTSVTRSAGRAEYPNSEVEMRGLPVTLNYQIDVYATKREVCDGLTAEIVLEMFETPYVNVLVESMGEGYTVQFNVDIEDGISDNTSISEFEDTNRFYRLSLTIVLTEALIYRISKSKGVFDKVEVSFSDFDANSLLDE